MIRHTKKQVGFTLIELMLALAFVAFVILFAVTTVIQVMQTYNKGLSVKQISQVGRTTLEEIAQQIRIADPSAVDVSAIPNYRVCLGGLSYVWNYKYMTTNRYDDSSVVRLARVEDPAKDMCNNSSGSYPAVPKAKAKEVVSSDIWVVAITMTAPSVSNPIVDVSVKLAIANDPALSGGQCIQGGNIGQACAVSNFSTTVAAGGSD